jgi:hypothetical protein
MYIQYILYALSGANYLLFILLLSRCLAINEMDETEYISVYPHTL